jgi:putative metallohydrolase (TIGR04338 family)
MSTAAVYRGEAQLCSLLDRANTLGGGRVAEIAGSRVTLPVERKFASLETIQAYVDRVLEHEGLPRAVTVRKRKGHAGAHYESLGAVIAIPFGVDWALRGDGRPARAGPPHHPGLARPR